MRELSKTLQHSDLGKNPTSNSVGFLVAQILYFSKIYKSSVCVCFFQKLNVHKDTHTHTELRKEKIKAKEKRKDIPI